MYPKATDEDYFVRVPTIKQQKYMARSSEMHELRQKQADRRALQTMRDKVELLGVEAKYLEISPDRQRDIKYALDQLMNELDR